MQSARKSWADRQGFRTGVFGETYEGIPIEEKNRATNWATDKEDIEMLRTIRDKSYRAKGVQAVIFGVWHGGDLRYAVFVQPGFLRDVEED